jgi:chlorobactene glucosyltransferase
MIIMLLALQILLTLACLAMLANGLINLWTFRRDWRLLRRQHLPRNLPLITVCVPARNEERNIAACLRSLARQSYPNLEVLVLDDCSTDKTFEIAQAVAAKHPAIRVLRGRPLEAGWIGKPHACQQLGEEARGAWLLFTDADTVFPPHALERALRLALARRADLLSGIPRLDAVTFWERLSVPMIPLVGMGGAVFELMTRLRWPWYGGASGAFLFFRRAAYEAVGGHQCVQDRIVEDVEMGRAVKRAGLRLVMTDLTRVVRCRMYTTLGEVWEGFTKNFYAAFPGPLFPVAIALLLAIFTAPWLVFIFGAWLGRGAWGVTILPLIQIGAIGLLKAIVDRLGRQVRFADLLLVPLAGVLMAAIATRSASRALLKQPTPWRARDYELWKS